MAFAKFISDRIKCRQVNLRIAPCAPVQETTQRRIRYMRLYTAEWRERKLLLYIVFCLTRIARQCDDVEYIEVTPLAVHLNDPVRCRHRECPGQKRARGVMHNARAVQRPREGRDCHNTTNRSLNLLGYDRLQLCFCASSFSRIYTCVSLCQGNTPRVVRARSLDPRAVWGLRLNM